MSRFTDEFNEASAEFAEAMKPTAKEMADIAAAYKRLQNPLSYVLEGGEQMEPKAAKKEQERLNAALKSYLTDTGGTLDVEGVGSLGLQYPTSEKVDVLSLYDTDKEAFHRLLESNGLEVNMDVLKGLERQGLIGAVPRFPIGSGAVRLVWVRG